MTTYYPKMMDKLLSVYGKSDDTNIAKILDIVASKLDELDETFAKMLLWKDIDEAKGTTLDLIGKSVGQQREGFNDTAYRALIKSKYIRDRSDGRINTIISDMAYLLNMDETDVLVEKGDNPATLYSEYDLDVTETTGLSLEKIGEISNSIVASGVSMDIYFRGSFLFASEYTPVADELDAEHGFGEIVYDDEDYYHSGDFALGSIYGTTTVGDGLSLEDMGAGGRFGALYTTEEIKAW